MFDSIGKLLLVAGLVIAALGGILLLAGKLPFLGRLPGDLMIRGERWSLYAPLTTCLLISVVLSLLLWLFGRR